MRAVQTMGTRPLEAVIVERALEAVLAVGKLGDAGAQAAAGVGEDVVERASTTGQAMRFDEPQQHVGAARIAADLRRRSRMRSSGSRVLCAISSMQVPVDLALAGDADDGQADAFLEDRPRRAGRRARGASADIGVMGDVAAEEADDALVMHRA